MSTKLLADLYLTLIEIVLLLINAGHVIIQLPIRRVGDQQAGVRPAGGDPFPGLMLYGSVAAASGKSALHWPSPAATCKKLPPMWWSWRMIPPAASAHGWHRHSQRGDADISANTQALDDIRTAWAAVWIPAPTQTLTSLADALYDGNAGPIILNSGLSHRLDSLDDYSTFTQDTRIIYEFSTTRSWSPSSPTLPSPPSPFVVVHYGIDAPSSDINIQSLSGVNILAG